MAKSQKPRLINLSDYTRISEQQGTNPGAFFKHNESGKKYYIKWLADKSNNSNNVKYKNRNRNCINNEMLATRLYELYGLSVPNNEFISFVDDKGLLHDGITSEKKEHIKSLEQADSDEFSQVSAQVGEGFLIDALLSNYDVAGFDNLFFDSKKKPFRLDQGGALRYYADGEAKKADFNNKVDEFKIMATGKAIDSPINSEILSRLSKVFKGIYNSPVLLISLRGLLSVSDEQLRDCVELNGFDIDDSGKGKKKNEELIAQLLQRKNTLTNKAETKIFKQLTITLTNTDSRRAYLQKAGMSADDIDIIISAIDNKQKKEGLMGLVRGLLLGLKVSEIILNSANNTKGSCSC